MWIRNNWIRGGRDTNLVKYFNKLGIYSPDDMSVMIITSLHRKLNHKPLNINEQVEDDKASWKPIIECDRIEKKKAVANSKNIMWVTQSQF